MPRKSNIELLRIGAMAAIVAGHFVSQSGIGAAVDGWNAVIAALAGSGCRIAVNVFLLVGVWFMVDAEFSWKRIWKLYGVMAFYSVTITVAMLAMGEAGSFRNIVQGFLPFFGRAYWFVTAYLSLMALSPYLKRVLDLPRKELRNLLAILFVTVMVTSSFPSANSLDYIADFAWFAVVYLFAGYVKRYGLLSRFGSRWLWLANGLIIYLCFCGASFTPAAGVARYWQDSIRALPNFLCAFSFFVFALKCDIGSVKVVNLAARSTFAVYVISCVPAFTDFEWHTLCRADRLVSLPPAGFVLALVAVVAGVYIACSLIDAVRIACVKRFGS